MFRAGGLSRREAPFPAAGSPVLPCPALPRESGDSRMVAWKRAQGNARPRMSSSSARNTPITG